MICWYTDSLGTSGGDIFSGAVPKEVMCLDLRDYVDAPGNSVLDVRGIIEKGVEYLAADKKVVVVCDYGISRSNSIAAGILSVSRRIPLKDAFLMVWEKCGKQEIKSEMINCVFAALNRLPERNPLSPKHILVTGGSGFVGSRLVPLLSCQYKVFSPSSRELDLLHGSLPIDLYVKDNGITDIIHLAAPHVYTSNRAMGDTLTMLRNILDVCRDNSLRLVFTSSHEAFSGVDTAGSVLPESSQPVGKGSYGETKALCEHLISMFRYNWGNDVAIIRSTPCYGPGSERPKFLFTFMEKAAKQQDIYTHQYKNDYAKICPLHVNDFATAIKAVEDVGYRGIVNVGGSEQYSTKQIAEMIVDRFHSSSRVHTKPIDANTPNIRFDNNVAQNVLKWQPQISFEDGLLELMRLKYPEVKFR